MKNRKVLFVHDGPRWKDRNGAILGLSTDLIMKQRYLQMGGQVNYLMRVFPVPNFLKSRLISISEANISVISVPPFNRPAYFHNYANAKAIIKQSITDHDIIIVRLPSTIGSIAFKYAKRLNKPLLVEVVACPWDALRHYSLLGKIYAPFAYLKLKRLVKSAPYVLYVTEHFLQKRYPNPYTNLGVSDVMLSPSSEDVLKNKIERLCRISKDQRVTLCTIAAVHVAYKGQEHVLKAISLLKQQGYQIRYLIIGGGNPIKLKKTTRKLNLVEEVDFLGMVEHSEVFSYLESCDIYVQPSDTEGLPRAVIEAMSRACPCICTKVGGMPELIDNQFLFPKRDVVELSKTIKYLVDNNSQLVEQSQKNFDRSKSFETNRLRERRERFYNDFLKNHNLYNSNPS